jgi:Uma2 family endonuclease
MATGTIVLPSPAAALITNQSPTEPLLNGDVLYEVVDNEIREVAPMNARETRFANNLSLALGQFGRSNSLGMSDVEMLFLIDKSRNLQRRPDVSFVSFQRWPKGKPVPATPAWEVVPDLAVEIVSASNDAYEVLEKVEEYFACGVRRVWLVYPPFFKVYDYDSPTSVRILTRADQLSGGDVVPGFDVPLSELFEEPTAAT